MFAPIGKSSYKFLIKLLIFCCYVEFVAISCFGRLCTSSIVHAIYVVVSLTFSRILPYLARRSVVAAQSAFALFDIYKQVRSISIFLSCGRGTVLSIVSC